MKVELTVTIIAFIGFVALLLIGASYSCEKQSKQMGMQYKWGFFHGCMIEYKPGKWVPLNNYRVGEKI